MYVLINRLIYYIIYDIALQKHDSIFSADVQKIAYSCVFFSDQTDIKQAERSYRQNGFHRSRNA